MNIRPAVPADVERIAALVNRAFTVERFFKVGDRTSPDEIASLLREGDFLVGVSDGSPAGSVFVRSMPPVGYFGMLSIEPTMQGRGLGRQFIAAAEAYLRERGCREVQIHIVNLREELPPFYRKLGYEDAGRLPFPTPELSTRPCHMIVMRKPLIAETAAR
jgi:GNAT superfamily N-acetyltransferase